MPLYRNESYTTKTGLLLLALALIALVTIFVLVALPNTGV